MHLPIPKEGPQQVDQEPREVDQEPREVDQEPREVDQEKPHLKSTFCTTGSRKRAQVDQEPREGRSIQKKEVDQEPRHGRSRTTTCFEMRLKPLFPENQVDQEPRG